MREDISPQPELDPLDHFNYTALLFSEESCKPL